MAKILLVEDDPVVADNVVDLLESERFAVERAANGADAIALLEFNTFDLLILDWQLPGASGPEICQAMRARNDGTPVLMLTARANIADKEEGFRVGVDDYLTKPFDLRELQMRVKALLRRKKSDYLGERLTYQDLSLDLEMRTAYSGNEEINLLPKEFSLLELFMRNPTRVFTAEQIVAAVWKVDEVGSQGALRQSLVRLRKKVNNDRRNLIHSIYGVGYKFAQPDS